MINEQLKIVKQVITAIEDDFKTKYRTATLAYSINKVIVITVIKVNGVISLERMAMKDKMLKVFIEYSDIKNASFNNTIIYLMQNRNITLPRYQDFWDRGQTIEIDFLLERINLVDGVKKKCINCKKK